MATKIAYIVCIAMVLAACRPYTKEVCAEEGITTPHIAAIDSIYQGLIDSAYLPCATVLVIRDSQVAHLAAYGYKDLEDSIPCQVDNLFRIASQTKALTVTALMILYELDLFSLDDSVARYLPEFSAFPYNQITIRHLLTHTSGIDEMGMRDSINLKDHVRELAQKPLKHNPGEAFTYGNGTDVIGRICEVLSGVNFEELLDSIVLSPLEMRNTYFHIPASDTNRLVHLYRYTNEGLVPTDQPFLQHFACCGEQYLCSPSAGLCSTITDYAHFCQMILDDGVYNGKRILKEETLKMMQNNAVGKMRGDVGFGFAWDYFYADSAQIKDRPHLIPSGSMRWGGAYGTDYIIDPKNKLILLVYTNCMPNQSPYKPKNMLYEYIYTHKAEFQLN